MTKVSTSNARLATSILLWLQEIYGYQLNERITIDNFGQKNLSTTFISRTQSFRLEILAVKIWLPFSNINCTPMDILI